MASLIEKTSTHIVLQAEVRNKKENWQPEGQKIAFLSKKGSSRRDRPCNQAKASGTGCISSIK
jgi:hypothetical protein